MDHVLMEGPLHSKLNSSTCSTFANRRFKLWLDNKNKPEKGTLALEHQEIWTILCQESANIGGLKPTLIECDHPCASRPSERLASKMHHLLQSHLKSRYSLVQAPVFDKNQAISANSASSTWKCSSSDQWTYHKATLESHWLSRWFPFKPIQSVDRSLQLQRFASQLNVGKAMS